MSEKCSHEGHRERLRQRYIDASLDAFADHEVIELLLTYSIPRRDVNELHTAYWIPSVPSAR